MVASKSVSSLLDLLEWRDHCLSHGELQHLPPGIQRARNESQINRKETNEQ
jgi:hypothetical protein